ncbi:Alpha/beta hydrolase family protein [Aspergillus parasiticus SU-1]|uniref:Alpha/beta hydrolase family protein n=1 Tax=Aspergillus parasiticus (strain ATCC 56775 / NRRL 5862 / SRRC 143 / SU-1) TaxID=1403190 RepID=A0A0F0IIT0_ASPPU|nr:Alpha/beta hydrolase family protein [Aspergillus parasiticus SU-1]
MMLSTTLILLLATVQRIEAATKHRVEFDSSGINLVGNLFLPDGVDFTATNASLPAVVVGHPWSGVKEQTAGLYAEGLAEHGFATLAFDAAYQGESGGLPRYLEDPHQRTEDVKNAVSYLTTLSGLVDPERIGGLGICASGGYVSYAAQTDKRIKALATVSAFDVGQYHREPWGGGEVNITALNELFAAASAQRTHEAATGDVKLIFSAPMSPEEVTPDLPLMFREAYDYYRTARGMHPRAPNVYVTRSQELMATYDSFDNMRLVSPRPVLIIYGSRADTGYFSQRAYANALEPKEEFVVPNATHFDLYDRTDATVPRLVDFLRESI